MRRQHEGNVIKSLDRGLQLLETLGTCRHGMSIPELSDRFEVDRSTVYRVLMTLTNRGYVVRDPVSGNYQLGPGIHDLAMNALKVGSNLHRIGAPHVTALSDKTGESAHLSILTVGGALSIANENSADILSVRTQVGTTAPLHCSAVGKVLFAYLPDDYVQGIADKQGLHRFTAKTITSLDELRSHLLDVKAQGYGVDDEEFHNGVRCIAAPVRDYREEVVGSMGISGPATRITPERIPELAEMVREACNELSRALGCRTDKESGD